jgi:hypothetical protein
VSNTAWGCWAAGKRLLWNKVVVFVEDCVWEGRSALAQGAMHCQFGRVFGGCDAFDGVEEGKLATA